jgi:hypothetical protein
VQRDRSASIKSTGWWESHHDYVYDYGNSADTNNSTSGGGGGGGRLLVGEGNDGGSLGGNVLASDSDATAMATKKVWYDGDDTREREHPHHPPASAEQHPPSPGNHSFNDDFQQYREWYTSKGEEGGDGGGGGEEGGGGDARDKDPSSYWMLDGNAYKVPYSRDWQNDGEDGIEGGCDPVQKELWETRLLVRRERVRNAALTRNIRAERKALASDLHRARDRKAHARAHRGVRGSGSSSSSNRGGGTRRGGGGGGRRSSPQGEEADPMHLFAVERESNVDSTPHFFEGR